MNIPDRLRYTEEHEWLEALEDGTIRIGITDYAQDQLGDVVFLELPSPGTEFEQGDLATPQINIAYGSWYLRYLLEHYHGNTILALAAYNAGEGKVDEWLARAAGSGETFRVARHVPFPETREYVTKVLDARRSYREQYARELGL